MTADPGHGARRLDVELVVRGLARSRSHAAELIGRRAVRVDDRPTTKASLTVDGTSRLDVTEDRYVSRAAHKLLGALDDLAHHHPLPTRPGWRALDAGASTGGFTQVLLERGAQTVYAVDVGHDQLADLVRSDRRVRNLERTNLRELTLDQVDAEPVDLVVADLSFISLTLVLEPLRGVLAADGTALLMAKPQFEVGRDRLGKNGLVRSDALRAEAVQTVSTAAAALGWSVVATVASRVPGPAGNLEFFVLLR